MSGWQERTETVIGTEGCEILKNARVIVFGVGGVGSYAVETLARTGIGYIGIVDSDTVSESNINRQLVALRSTVGMKKTQVAKSRIYDINPDCFVEEYDKFYSESDPIDISRYDYVIDAIDSISSKVFLIKSCAEAGVPVISSMGTGNKTDPTRLRIEDIYKTSVCPLARVMRTRLKKEGIKKLKVVYSTEEPVTAGQRTPGSVAFVPGCAGIMLAAEAVNDILKHGKM